MRPPPVIVVFYNYYLENNFGEIAFRIFLNFDKIRKPLIYRGEIFARIKTGNKIEIMPGLIDFIETQINQ